MQAPRVEAQTLPPPPGIIGSLRSGFDAIAANVAVILVPLGLDLFLWLGPHLSMAKVLQPLVDQWATLPNTGGIKVEDLQKFIQDFNVFGMLRTFPIGVPSLMSGVMPDQTPLGLPSIVEVQSAAQLLALMVGVSLAGWILGAIYFRWVAALAAPALPGHEHAGMGRAVSQTLLYAVLWTVTSWIIGIPVSLLLSVLFMINVVLGEGMLLLLGFLSMWLIVPLFFSPQGMFLRKQNAVQSVMSGFHLTRFTLPTSSLFVLTVFLLGIGLNVLWARPSSDSWMMLVGIVAHAFVTTALLASSFVYYHNMSSWLQVALERLRAGMPGQQL